MSALPHAVVIGRNEGARLIACLTSLRDQVDRLIYVDSGSTDGSAAAAADLGAEVVALDMAQPFTAARARNAGLARLPETGLVQMVDGDCVVQPDWINTAAQFLADHPEIAVVCGRRRESAPDASIYNALCDAEWDTPVGAAKSCGGDALMRLEALRQVNFYDPGLIAGEEPELCVRLRQAGWGIWRLDAEMTLHDAAMMRISQWWARTQRAGYAFAQGAAMHGAPPERHWVRERTRALVWGLGIPLWALALVGTGWAWVPLLAYPAQVVRLGLRIGWRRGLFTVLGKFPETLGALQFYIDRLRGRSRGLIEYK